MLNGHFNDLDTMLDGANVDIELAVSELECIVEACSLDLRKVKRKLLYRNNQPWFDHECQQVKCRTRRLLNKFPSLRSENNLSLYLQSKQMFKRLCKVKRYVHKRNTRMNLINL